MYEGLPDGTFKNNPKYQMTLEIFEYMSLYVMHKPGGIQESFKGDLLIKTYCRVSKDTMF